MRMLAAVVGGLIGSFICTFLLTRLVRRICPPNLDPESSAYIAFGVAAVVVLGIGGFNVGLWLAAAIYLPSLILALPGFVWVAKPS